VRVLFWVDTFYEYVREPRDGPITKAFKLILQNGLLTSQNVVKVYVLEDTLENISDDDDDIRSYVEWIENSFGVISSSLQDLSNRDVEIIVTTIAQDYELNVFKERGINVLSPEEFLRFLEEPISPSPNPSFFERLSSVLRLSIPGSWRYVGVGLLAVVFVIASSTGFSRIARNQSPLNSPNVGDCTYDVIYSTAEEVRSACQNVSKNHHNYSSALRNEARALILLWYGEGEHGKPSQERDNELLDLAIDRLDMSLNQSQSEDPSSLFFRGLALSIRDFVVRGSNREFDLVLRLYQEAAEKYLELDNSHIRIEDYIPMIEIGHFLVKNCEYKIAIRIYDKVLAVAPNHPGALGSKGIALFLEENDKRSDYYKPSYSRASQLLNSTEKLLIEDGQSSEGLSGIYHNLGSIAVHETRYEDAVIYFNRSIGLMVSDHLPYLAWRGKGFAQLMANQAPEAFATFHGAIDAVKKAGESENSKYYSLWLGRGIANQQLEKIEDARSDFKKAKELYLSKDDVFELSSLLSQYTDLDQPAPSIESIQSSFRNLFGAVSIHADYQGIEDEVVEVEHDRLYPGAQGFYCK
jgi:tetratricopeptide (TPR) repeat protein